MHIAKWKSYILCNSNYMTLEKKNYGDSKRIGGFQPLEGGRDEEAELGGF